MLNCPTGCGVEAVFVEELGRSDSSEAFAVNGGSKFDMQAKLHRTRACWRGKRFIDGFTIMSSQHNNNTTEPF